MGGARGREGGGEGKEGRQHFGPWGPWGRIRLLPLGKWELWRALGRRGQDLTWVLMASSGGRWENALKGRAMVGGDQSQLSLTLCVPRGNSLSVGSVFLSGKEGP